MGGNVTVDPRERATPVDDPAIIEARSRRTGRLLDAKRLIRSFDYAAAIRLRGILKDAASRGRPRLVCPMCGVTLFLASSMRKNFYLRHRSEDGSCPAVTHSGLTEPEMRAMKYRGAQESDAHLRTKELLVHSLAADPGFSDVRVEATWRASEGLVGLRRPDVSARCGDLRAAFEVQLSTTFLDVVLGRKRFYREEGAALVWILPSFDPSYRRMTTDDILFGNNSNILVVDEATVAASIAASQLIVRVWHRQPRIDGEHVVDDWVERLVAWSDLLIDIDRQTVCAFDFAAAESAAISELGRLREQQKAAEEAARRAAAGASERKLRTEIFEWALAEDRVDDLVGYYQRWTELNYDLVAYCADLLSTPSDVRVPIRMVKVIETAKAGKPVGFGYDTLVEVAHHLFHQRPELLMGFGYLLRAYGHHHLLAKQDASGKWAGKVSANRVAMRCDPRFQLAEDEQRLFDFLSEDLCRKPAAGEGGK
ncbi:DUF6035 family protein [Sphingobium sp. BS19]|uniref:DUF6035 family protein n=1 Tax=Sphingobium sp. BS19 TaxID=3018973 RepID=UPI0022EDD0AC|nr:DUF6035 family protein [Sphingobium sp. BS19]GLI99539.1 hypothetical protein Sbs19_33570 [Sphingobium sp. BS19]